ncbi:MAG: hypothetical protein HYV27_14175 [Candidatus Hydrogenedentes bacterium]|nr:hypothetical protein [Candidatus Hydrogenedentota bacterium]
MGFIQRTAWRTLLIVTAGAVLFTGCDGIPFDPEEAGFPGPKLARIFNVHIPFPGDVSILDPIFDDIRVYFPYGAPPEDGYPLIIFSGGWNQEALSYNVFAKNLAQWGFVCVLRASPSLGLLNIGSDLFNENRQHVRDVLAWAEEAQLDPSSPLFKSLNLNAIGLAGHSLGGSISIVGATEEPRVAAVVSMDAVFERTNSPHLEPILAHSPPTMHLVAELGGYCTFPPFGDQVITLFNVVQTPMAEVVLKGADHMDYDPLSEEGRFFCPAGTADEVVVRALASKYMVAWFKMHLDPEEKDFPALLTGDSARADVADGYVAIHLNYVPESG